HLCQQIAVINRGRIEQLDTPQRLYEQPRSRFVAEFIGESTFLPVETSERGVFYAGERLTLPDAPVPMGRCVLMVRPERLRILNGTIPNDVNVLRGVVHDAVYQGDSVLLRARLADGSLVGARGVSGRGAMAALPAPGETVALGLAAEDTVLIAEEGVR
ncbi:MAG: TOBE domain-containing protein, partial [Alphaproteobacteria bacterium]|nr:TOBE domain-containing protein [Alphaproteobacteria bacterium]